jgi:hypothetical protein
MDLESWARPTRLDNITILVLAINQLVQNYPKYQKTRFRETAQIAFAFKKEFLGPGCDLLNHDV